MNLAKDGKPYDIDNLEGKEPKENEIEVIQYLRPDGRRRRTFAPCDPKLAKVVKANGYILLGEELSTGVIALYGRRKDQEEEILTTVENGPEVKIALNQIIQDLITLEEVKSENRKTNSGKL